MINTLAIDPSTAPATSLQSLPADRAPGSFATAEKSVASTTSAEATPAKPAAQPDIRLMIEENKDAPGFIYKLVDSITGVTLAEIPREADSTATVSHSYTAGAVVSTSA